jgi:phenylalanyl-tRNA synthetase beta chain
VNVSLNWLAALLGHTLQAEDVARRLTMLGAPVEAVEPVHHDLGDVVVGLVERVERHPNADRLSLCYVNDGSRILEVVCGAPNVAAGRRYPFAPVGAVLPGGLKLEARRIRGVVSHGMLCSARELGLGTDHEGILELRTDEPPGTPLTAALPVADTRLALEITPNRPDLLGHKGVARELGAVYGWPVKLPAFPRGAVEGPSPRRAAARGSVDGVEVRIEDVSGCPRYIAAVIRGVTVAPSPAWLQARLISIGARPINNVVDATNYILYELNQPLHAFDLARLAGPAVIIRRARAGERITTLDGETRSLTPEMTVICDADKPQALAGIMGGRESEVSAATTDVLLECAYFDPKRIRATRKALKLDTEASYRFERGTDPFAMADAVRRAVALIRTVAGGTEVEAALDLYPAPAAPRAVFLRPERVALLLGVRVPEEDLERHLSSVGFVVAPKDGRLHVQVPGWRPDVTAEVDLIEEVARLRGYDTFPEEFRPFRPSNVPDDPVEACQARIRRALTGLGLHEARLMPLGPAAEHEEADTVQVVNPVSRDFASLRRSLTPGLLRAVERNWALRQREVRLFEIGHVFQRAPGGRPQERLALAGVVTGARRPPHWTEGFRPPDYDLWDLKAIFEVAVRAGGPAGTIEPASGGGWRLVDRTGRERGWARELAVERPPWAGAVFGFELEVEGQPASQVSYRPRPVTPPVERDLALVVPEGVTAAHIEQILKEAGQPLLEEVSVFDEYRKPGVPGRSLAWRLVFRAPDRTLRDEEVDQAIAGLLEALKERLGVVRREA